MKQLAVFLGSCDLCPNAGFLMLRCVFPHMNLLETPGPPYTGCKWDWESWPCTCNITVWEIFYKDYVLLIIAYIFRLCI